MKKSRTTIKDVAKMANVTPQTVSRAIRGTPNVAEETKARILKIAAQLNYCKTQRQVHCVEGQLILLRLFMMN